jgi:hypothetical protein
VPGGSGLKGDLHQAKRGNGLTKKRQWVVLFARRQHLETVGKSENEEKVRGIFYIVNN